MKRFAPLILFVAFAGCTPHRVDPGTAIPGAATSLGRADLLSTFIRDEAKRGQIKHAAGKDALGRIVGLSVKLDAEHWTLGRQLEQASTERASLINQVIDKTHELIAEHAANKWTGWKAREIWFWIKTAILAAGLLWVAGAVYSIFNPLSWIGRVFLHNAPLAGPVARMAGVELAMK